MPETPSPAEDAATTAPPDATRLWESIRDTLTPAQTGVAAIKPTVAAGRARLVNPTSLGARPQTPAELKAAKIGAAEDLESRVNKAADFIDSDYALAGMAASHPAEAHDLGIDPNSLWESVKSGLGSIGRPVLTGLDLVGTKLDAPAQALFGGLIAAKRGEDPFAGASAAFGRSAFNASNPERIWGSDVLKEYGVPAGPSLKDAAREVSEFANAHLGTSLHLQDITPDINARAVAGMAGEILNPLDPLNKLHIGAAPDAIKLASGRALNAAGESAYRAVESAHFLRNLTEHGVEEGAMGAKAAERILADAGVSQALERARLAIEVLTAKTPASAAEIARHQASIAFAHARVNEVAERALAEGNDGILQHLTAASKAADNKIDSLLASSDAAKQRLGALQRAMTGKLEPALIDALGVAGAPPAAMKARLAEEIATASKQLLRWDDPGGLKLGPLQIVPGKPLRDAASSLVAKGERVRAIEPLIHAARTVSESVGRVFEPLWGTPPAFRRYVKEELYGRTVAMHKNVNDVMTRLFKGVSLAERTQITKAIDSGGVEALPQKLQGVAASMTQMMDELFAKQVASGHLKETDRAANYIYHYYTNERQAAELFATRARSRTIREFRDPSTYQRTLPTLAEAEALGLKPEYDAAKLLTMRLVNGQHQLIQHAFLAGAAEKFGLPKLVEGAVDEADAAARAAALNAHINSTLREGGAALSKPLRTEELLRAGHIDLADPANVQPIAYQLAREGGTSLETLRSLPDPYKSEFMRWRLIKARSGGAHEMANVEAKYREFLHLAPRGEAGDRLANALGLPRPQAGDGRWVNADIPHVGPVELPRRIAEKMAELGKRESIWSEEGKPLQDLGRMYDKLLLNRFRIWNTAPNPAFHFRNAWNNLVQSGMDIGYSVLDPASRLDAIAMTRGDARHIIRLKTGPVSARELEREFIGQGLYTSFLQRAQVNAPNAAQAAAEEVVRETSTLHKVTHAPFYVGGAIGETIENDARRLHFLSLRKDGISAPAAAERVQKFLFDYQNDYTPTEREVLRRILPFYGWASKNLELQAGQLVTHPKVALNWWRVGQTMQRDERDPMRPQVERALMPAYLESQFGIRVGERDGGTVSRWLFGADVPVADLNGLWAGSAGRTLDHWASQGGPVVEVVQALYATVIGGGKEWRLGEKDDARTYAIFGKLRDEAPALTDWLHVHQEIDRRTGQNYWVADRNRVQAMLGAMMMMPVVGGDYSRPLRDLSRLPFIDPNTGDSGWSALAHYLTGGSFTDFTPEDEASARISQTLGDAAQSASQQQRDLEMAIVKSSTGGAK